MSDETQNEIRKQLNDAEKRLRDVLHIITMQFAANEYDEHYNDVNALIEIRYKIEAINDNLTSF